MRYYLIIVFAILFTSCCKDKGVDKIKDKSWFPFNSNSSIVYETKHGLIDSLAFVKLDTLNKYGGEWGCGSEWENRSCNLQSSKFKDFKIHINLSTDHLDFLVYYSDKFINLYYKTDNNKQSSYPHELSLIDSVDINNMIYYKMLILTDSTNDFVIFYNRIGIPRYIIHKDTFDLKK